MRKFMGLLAILFVVVACSSDDNSSNPPQEAGLVGVWTLLAYNLDQAVDVNLDGVPSTNVLEEVPCFTSTVVFSSDGSFTSGTNEFEIVIGDIDITVTCGDQEVLNGTWSLSGNQLTTTVEGESETETINLDGNMFSFVIADPDFGDGELIFFRLVE